MTLTDELTRLGTNKAIVTAQGTITMMTGDIAITMGFIAGMINTGGAEVQPRSSATKMD
jgi:hypothetical protein